MRSSSCGEQLGSYFDLRDVPFQWPPDHLRFLQEDFSIAFRMNGMSFREFPSVHRKNSVVCVFFSIERIIEQQETKGPLPPITTNTITIITEENSHGRRMKRLNKKGQMIPNQSKSNQSPKTGRTTGGDPSFITFLRFQLDGKVVVGRLMGMTVSRKDE